MAIKDDDYWLAWGVERARRGGRNRAAFKLSCQLRDNKYTQAEAEEVVLRYANEVDNRDDRFTESEALMTLRSAYKRPPRDECAPLDDKPYLKRLRKKRLGEEKKKEEALVKEMTERERLRGQATEKELGLLMAAGMLPDEPTEDDIELADAASESVYDRIWERVRQEMHETDKIDSLFTEEDGTGSEIVV